VKTRKGAIQDELDYLKRNQTWTLMKLLEGKRAVNCKWGCKIKRGSENEGIKYKARLVAVKDRE
jgi:hypothetical protein